MSIFAVPVGRPVTRSESDDDSCKNKYLFVQKYNLEALSESKSKVTVPRDYYTPELHTRRNEGVLRIETFVYNFAAPGELGYGKSMPFTYYRIKGDQLVPFELRIEYYVKTNRCNMYRPLFTMIANIRLGVCRSDGKIAYLDFYTYGSGICRPVDVEKLRLATDVGTFSLLLEKLVSAEQLVFDVRHLLENIIPFNLSLMGGRVALQVMEDPKMYRRHLAFSTEPLPSPYPSTSSREFSPVPSVNDPPPLLLPPRLTNPIRTDVSSSSSASVRPLDDVNEEMYDVPAFDDVNEEMYDVPAFDDVNGEMYQVPALDVDEDDDEEEED
jgi:hypothetical protein